MTCKNCKPQMYKPGMLIKVTKDLAHCSICGDRVINSSWGQHVKSIPHKKWDSYFYSICKAVASKSPCLSRKIGAIIVRDKSIISTGYNGPPRGTPHCGHERLINDKVLQEEFDKVSFNINLIESTCPRRILGYESGTHMELCPAQHAEENTISNAARLGVNVINSTLYMNSIIPCKNCFGTLINAGITEVVVEKLQQYDIYSEFLISNSGIKIREFKI